MSPIIRSIARGLFGLVLVLMFISGLAQLAGCGGNSDSQLTPDQSAPVVDCRDPKACS